MITLYVLHILTDNTYMETNENKKRSRSQKLRMILDSATFALLLSLLLFSFEMINGAKETEEIVDNLVEIQNSLSTRYLGLFPEYIDNINNLLNDAIEHQGKNTIRDSVIIFEDVLYYGILSDAEGFRLMVESLLTLANHGCHVTMAFYNPGGMPFKHMIRDKLISEEYRKQYRNDLESYLLKKRKLREELGQLPAKISKEEHDKTFRELLDKHFKEYFTAGINDANMRESMRNIENYTFVDSTICQKYYEKTRQASMRKFTANVKGYLNPIPQKQDAIDAVSVRVNKLCSRLDEIKHCYLGKVISDITYSDYYNMYKDMTDAIYGLLESQPNIDMIPLDETLMMSCWMTIIDDKEQAIFAFPSKYSTDEIGFISQDAAIARYIHTMLAGVKSSQNIEM